MSSPRVSPSSTGFRLDINLLRAIAVTGVVLFHFRLGSLTGGFAGVDVFFVVSGYLMTKIISDGLDRGTFSLWRFYAARARRILPALGALCLFLLVFAQFFIDPLTRREIASGIASSILFVSNIAYWREAGYFDAVAKEKWLLHTWSLSVEWQFYLVLPLALVALRRLLPGRRSLLITLWIGMVLSFALAATLAEIKPAFAFYMLPTRAWEMLAGGLVYLHVGGWRAGPRLSTGLAALGLVLIATSFIGLDDLVPWPSFATLLPVAGTVLVLAARQETAPGLNSRPLKAIGLWSYSIYIWHWPIAVGLGYFGHVGTPASITGLVVTLVLSGLSYQVIETPFRQPAVSEGARLRPSRAMLAGLVLLLGTTTASFVAARGYGPSEDRLAARTQLAEEAIGDGGMPPECGGFSVEGRLRPCVIGAPSAKNILFLGDSHAEPFYTHYANGRPDHSFTFLTYGGCPPLPDIGTAIPGSRCQAFFDAAWKRAESGDYQKVVIAAFWPIYLTPYQRGGDNNHLLCFEENDNCRIERDAERYRSGIAAAFETLAIGIRGLKERGVEVILLQTTPYAAFEIPRESVKRAFRGIEPDALLPIPVAETREAAAESRRYLEALATSTGAELIDPLTAMCYADGCPVAADGIRPLYRDSNHLTDRAIRDGRLDFIDAAILGN